jgi:oxygen-independent coproporphyrinogen-3 oxidase
MAGIYIHIPFCSQACYYCDFHFSTSLRNKSKIIYAIIKEIQTQKNYLNGEKIHTIYFGGGTPSILLVDELSQIFSAVKDNFALSNNLECTLEANPEDINEKKLNEWFNLGINRLSLGVQSFRNKDLNYMNRSHTATEAVQSIELIKKSKISNFSIDLIYGFPLLTNTAWLNNLEKCINFNVPHISCYCLTVEKKTPLFHMIKKGDYRSLDPLKGKEQFLIARKVFLKNGYTHYEISNFSKPAFYSQHNKNYWNSTNYLGVGPSAHSYNGISRRWNVKNNALYFKKINNNECIFKEEVLTKKNILNEYILTSIRTKYGLKIDYVFDKMTLKQKDSFKKEINKLEKKKFVIIIDRKIFLTEKGMLFADSIAENLFII